MLTLFFDDLCILFKKLFLCLNLGYIYTAIYIFCLFAGLSDSYFKYTDTTVLTVTWPALLVLLTGGALNE